MASIEVQETRHKDIILTTSSGDRGTATRTRILKRWRPSGTLISDTGFVPSSFVIPPGCVSARTVEIVRNRRRCATSYDNPSEVGFTKRKKLGLYIEPHPYLSDVRYAVVSSLTGISAGSSVVLAGVPTSFERALDASQINSTSTLASNLAIAKFWAAARNRTVVESGVLIAELRQSMGMAANAVLTVIEILRWLKKGRFDKAVEALIKHGRPISRSAKQRFRNYSETSGLSLTKWMASAWLELQFGWKPLLQDVFNIMEATTDKMNGEFFPTLTLRGKGPTLTLRKDSYAELDSQTGAGHDEFLSGITYQADATITALFRVDSSLTVLNAFGLDNPAAIAWELVPFSFVVDWFLPIGKYLSNLSALNGLELIHATEFKRITSRCDRLTTKRRTWGYSVACECATVRYTRNVLSAIPPENFQIPNLPNLIDGWKFTTALSLLEQRRR